MPLGDRPHPLRRLLFLFLTLTGLTGLVVDMLLLGPISQPDLPPPPPERTIPNTSLNPFGVNVFLDREVLDWKKQATIEMIDLAGIGWVKQQFSWAEIEPKNDYYWDDKYGKSSWEKFDRIVDLAEEYDLEVIARIDRPPAWARPEGSNPQAPPYNPKDYADFIEEFIHHYQGRIHYIQIWNEPNLHTEWRENAPVDARAYVSLLRMAYERAKAVDPNIQILCAPLAVRTQDDPNRLALSELTYLEEMYRAGVAQYFDIMSANAYGFDDPPETPPDPGRLNFRRVELLRIVMEKYGDSNKAIWFNEYGWNTAPPDIPSIWGHVSEQEQADWTVRGVRYARENWPWAGVFSLWYFRPVDIDPNSGEYYFRMVNEDFTPLPIYAAVQDYAIALALATPGRYEELAPPIGRQGAWSLLYDSKASGKSYASSNEPGSQLVLNFQGSELYLLVRCGPDGGRLLVTLDGVAGRGTSLPRDAFGRAFLDLYSPTEQWETVHLIQGLEREFFPRTHHLELTVAEEKAAQSSGHLCALDAFEVGYHRSYILFGMSAGLLLSGTTAALIALIREFRRPTPPATPSPRNPWTLQPNQVRGPDEDVPSLPPPEEA